MTRRLAVILVPEFTYSTLVSTLDVAQAANRVLGYKFYEWSLYGATIGPVTASNGLKVFVGNGLDDLRSAHTCIVCSGLNPSRYASKALLSKLRFLRYHGSRIGGLCTGSFALAAAGLLDDRACTVHWQFVPSFREMFPSVNVTESLFEADEEFFSSAGLGTIDLMLDIVSKDHGPRIADAVAETLCHRRRERTQKQRTSLSARLGTRNGRILGAIQIMESNLDGDVRTSQIAQQVGISVRQLERLFIGNIGVTPKAFFRQLKFERAQLLLRETTLPISEVAVACGFSFGYFSKLHRCLKGVPPRLVERS